MINVDNLVKELKICLEDEDDISYKVIIKRGKRNKSDNLTIRINNSNDSVDFNGNEYASISVLIDDVRSVLREWNVPSFVR